MFYIVSGVVFLVLVCVVIWFVYSTAKEIGELEGILKAEEANRKQYEKDKQIVLNNDNLTHDELISKLHDIQTTKQS